LIRVERFPGAEKQDADFADQREHMPTSEDNFALIVAAAQIRADPRQNASLRSEQTQDADCADKSL
jgi:hypothetical protein